MAISVFDLFKIGIGPSSSHTVGPMKAARIFSLKIAALSDVQRIKVDLYGSLALTGKGHGTDWAVALGLEGETPDQIDPSSVESRWEAIQEKHTLNFYGRPVLFEVIFHYDRQLPFHPNGMRFTAYGAVKECVSDVYYSVGGGFIIDHATAAQDKHLGDETHPLPYPFKTGGELLKICQAHRMTIQQVMFENEKTWRSPEEIHPFLIHIWNVMEACIERGFHQEGILPGGLNVQRRAPILYHHLTETKERHAADVMEWVSVFALAVNEENAAGGRVVTAPTNGAAGVIPAVLSYYKKFIPEASEEGIAAFLLVAGAIGILYKEGASISAAEMGCMGEVGVACSMAAAGLTAALGGTVDQIENAAEIGMEHNLGLTCDPIKGLVQIPCIERNTMGAVKAINASLLALRGDGKHRVSLDQVIATMRETGQNMKSIYKETSLGGLAVNVPEC